MNKITTIITLLFVSIALVILSETVILAKDVDKHISPKFDRVVSNMCKESAELEPCDCTEPISTEAFGEASSDMKDVSYSLAFICRGSEREISLEEYLVGVVMSEVPHTFELEAIKAQAVAARTYAIRELDSGTRHRGNALCNDPSHCSAFISKDEYISKYGEDEYEKAYTIVKRAVNDTDGEIITYNGEPCCAVYHSSSDGQTESSYNLWGTKTPYLMSVKSNEALNSSIVDIKESQMKKILSCYGKIDAGKSEPIISYNDTGRCKSLSIFGITVSGKEARTAFGLKSSDFTISYNNGIYTFNVKGYGHGIGLSQYGANEMAKSGHVYSEILLHYYTGVTIDKIK